MKISLLKESGYEEALLGITLSYNTTIKRAEEIASKLAFGKEGEAKFLESIILWLDVTAPRYWWQEADTYRLSTKQSESTMHTIMKRPLTQEDFEIPVHWMCIEALNSKIKLYKDTPVSDKSRVEFFRQVKSNLPEGFLQRRIWCMSYKTLQNIYQQRHDHRLPEWGHFCSEVVLKVAHPEFIKKEV